YISPRDLTQLFSKAIDTPHIENEHGVPWQVVYGISNNTRAFWSLANARKVLGYEPEDDSEVKFAKDIQGFLVGDGATGGLGRVGRGKTGTGEHRQTGVAERPAGRCTRPGQVSASPLALQPGVGRDDHSNAAPAAPVVSGASPPGDEWGSFAKGRNAMMRSVSSAPSGFARLLGRLLLSGSLLLWGFCAVSL